MQARLTKRLAGLLARNVNYTLQKAEQDSGDYFIWPPERVSSDRGPADWDRTHNFIGSLVAEFPIGTRAEVHDRRLAADRWIVGGWQFNTNTVIQSGLPFNVTYRDAGADRDTGPNRPNLIGDPDGPQTRDDGSMRRRSARREAPSSGRRRGRSATCPETSCAVLATGGSTRRSSSTSSSPAAARLKSESRRSNLFNHVNLGNPDAEIGVPGNQNPNAGRITSTAYGGNDLQRNFQFAGESQVLALAKKPFTAEDAEHAEKPIVSAISATSAVRGF